MKISKTKKQQNDDQVIASCQKCGHQHVYPTLKILDQLPIDMVCDNCGYQFIKHLRLKIQATTDLLLSDIKAVELITAGKIKEFNDYFEKKTGFSKLDLNL